MTVAPESWAELTPLEVIHRLAAIVRQRLTPPPAPTGRPHEGIGPTADYAAARAQIGRDCARTTTPPAHLTHRPDTDTPEEAPDE